MKEKLVGLKIAGIGFIALGVIHELAGFVVVPELYQLLPAREAISSAVMFEATGMAILLDGLLVLYARRAWLRGEEWPRPIIPGAIGFVLLVGIVCVAAMPSNPFAYLSALVAAAGLEPYIRKTKQEAKI